MGKYKQFMRIKIYSINILSTRKEWWKWVIKTRNKECDWNKLVVNVSNACTLNT